MRRVTAFLWKSTIVVLLILSSAVFGWAFQSRTMLPLEAWHTSKLEGEFTAADAASHPTLQDYLAREDALFAEVKNSIDGRVDASDATLFSRYRSGGTQDPQARPQDWNRTFELVPEH